VRREVNNIMAEHELDQWIREEVRGYRPPPEPGLDAMWERIESRAFAPESAVRLAHRRGWWSALAAALLLGVALGFSAGRITAPHRGAGVPRYTAATPNLGTGVAPLPNPFVGIAADYLQQTTVLLVTVANGLRDGRLPPNLSAQARHLLSTTRLLLDTGEPDPSLHELLEDLELVLAQVAHLPGHHQAREVAFITEALDQRDLLPRLSLLLADASYAP
jgi:hypothetical protein